MITCQIFTVLNKYSNFIQFFSSCGRSQNYIKDKSDIPVIKNIIITRIHFKQEIDKLIVIGSQHLSFCSQHDSFWRPKIN